MLSGEAALDGGQGQVCTAGDGGGDLADLGCVVALGNDFDYVGHDGSFGLGGDGCRGLGGGLRRGEGFGTAANTYGGIGGDADKGDFKGLPVGDAVGFQPIVCLDQLRFVDHVADTYVAADAVNHVLPHFFCTSAFSKTHHGTTYPVGTDFDRFDNAHNIFGVVVAK